MIYKGNPVSAGIAIGSAFVYDPKILTAPEDAPVLPMECELERYENAVQAAQAKLREIQAAFTGKDDDKAEIFSAHLDMVDDEEISEEIRSAIHAGTGAAKAVEQVYQRYADLLAALDDDFMVQRAHDLLDVQQRLLRILLGALEQNLSRLDGFGYGDYGPGKCARHRCPKGRLYLTFGHHCPRVGHPGGAGYPRYYELCFFGGYDRAGCHCGEFAQRAHSAGAAKCRCTADYVYGTKEYKR